MAHGKSSKIQGDIKVTTEPSFLSGGIAEVEVDKDTRNRNRQDNFNASNIKNEKTIMKSNLPNIPPRFLIYERL